MLRLEKQGLIGNALSGGSDLLVIEADESDGTLVKYSPEATVVLNISKDHKDVEEIKGLFETLIFDLVDCVEFGRSDPCRPSGDKGLWPKQLGLVATRLRRAPADLGQAFSQGH